MYPEWLHQRYKAVNARLSDVGAGRIRLMDAAGIDMQVLTHVQPGVQILSDADAELAVAVSREVNDWLAEAIAAHPRRLTGFAMLPTQSPGATSGWHPWTRLTRYCGSKLALPHAPQRNNLQPGWFQPTVWRPRRRTPSSSKPTFANGGHTTR